MATATITITDDPARGEGEVSVHINLHGPFDPDSEAHTMAADLAMDMKQGACDDEPAPR